MTFLNFTFQDPSPLISYSDGQWVEGSPINDTFASSYSQGSFKVTSEPGARANLLFVGNSITIYGAKRLNHGNYSVVLDNEPEYMGDGNGNNTFQFPLWNAQNLTYGRHLAVLTNNPTSQGEFLDVDFISIGREIGPPGYNGPIYDLAIDDESPIITFDGSWASISSATALNSSLHNTTEAGATVSLYFQGSSVELYGLYVNAPFQVTLDNQLPLDLAGPNVDLNAQQQHPQTLLFYADGLDENQTHVVKLTNTISNEQRPLYFDYAIVRSSHAFLNDTPGLNSNFTMSSMSKLPRTRSVPDGAIVGAVVGGVGGLIILGFVGFFLLRWSRRLYHPPPSSSKSTEGRNARQSRSIRIRARNDRITPFILPSTTLSIQASSTSAPSFNVPSVITFSKSPFPNIIRSQPVTQQTHHRLASIASESDSRLSGGDSRNRLPILLGSTAA